MLTKICLFLTVSLLTLASADNEAWLIKKWTCYKYELTCSEEEMKKYAEENNPSKKSKTPTDWKKSMDETLLGATLEFTGGEKKARVVKQGFKGKTPAGGMEWELKDQKLTFSLKAMQNAKGLPGAHTSEFKIEYKVVKLSESELALETNLANHASFQGSGYISGGNMNKMKPTKCGYICYYKPN